MNFTKQRINFRQVTSGDTFDPVLNIDPAFEMPPGTSFEMHVTTDSDISEPPIISFLSGENVTIDGQKLRFMGEAEEMKLRPGMFVFDGVFTRGEEKTTLFGGLFEIINKTSIV